MTDITELAQRLKLEVHRAVSDFNPNMNIKTRDLKELVDALEKAQQRIDELLPSNRNMLMPALVGLSRDHLVVTIQTVVDNYSALHTKWLEDRQRIAELESRTVTVKLPDLRQIVSGDRYVWSDGVYNYSQDVKAALTAAGIKVEAE